MNPIISIFLLVILAEINNFLANSINLGLIQEILAGTTTGLAYILGNFTK